MNKRLMRLIAVFLCAVCCFSVGGRGQTAATPSPGEPKTDWEVYKSRTYTPSVDQHLQDPALVGAVDLHAHCDPDVYPRQWDCFEVAHIDKERGMRGVVFKNHYTETGGLAYLIRKYGTQGIEVYGGLALDSATGGVNPQAVRYLSDELGHYGRIVWMPTHDSEHEVTYTKQHRAFVSVSRNGQLLPEVLEVLDVIAEHDLTLGTGHVSAEEALMIIKEAKKRGVKRIILTHPLLAPQYTYMSLDQLREAKAQGAFMEIVAKELTGPPAEKARVLEALHVIGPESTIVSSDGGLTGGPNHADALALAARSLRASGFTESDINKMFKDNPAYLIKLPLLSSAKQQADSDNPQVGKWKMNIAKSTFSTGTGFRSATSVIEAIDGGVRHTLETVYADGTSRNYTYSAVYNGKDTPVEGSSPYGDTTALSRVDAHTFQTVYKKDGKVTVIQTTVVSDDGKTRIVTTKGTNPLGQPVNNVSVYDRQ